MVKKKSSPLSRPGSPLTLLAVALISATVFFLLGTVVGREYAIREGLVPVKEQVEETLPLDRDEVMEEVPRVEKKKRQERVDINFYDQLEKEGDKEINQPPAENNPKVRKSRKNSKETSEKKKKEKPLRLKTVAATNTGNYAIQVAAFRSRSNAQKVTRKLAKQGFSTHVLTVTVPGKGVFYRVWVGYYGSVSEAIKARRYLLEQTRVRISRATIVKR